MIPNKPQIPKREDAVLLDYLPVISRDGTWSLESLMLGTSKFPITPKSLENARLMLELYKSGKLQKMGYADIRLKSAKWPFFRFIDFVVPAAQLPDDVWEKIKDQIPKSPCAFSSCTPCVHMHMTTYRDICGCVGKSWEHPLVQDLEYADAHEIFHVWREEGAYAAGMKIWELIYEQNPETLIKKGSENITLGEIAFRSVSYPTRVVNIPDYGEELISTEALEEAVIDEYDDHGSTFVSEEARSIDDEIFFYAPDKAIKTFDDERLVNFITGSLGNNTPGPEKKACDCNKLHNIAANAICFMSEQGLDPKEIADYLGIEWDTLIELGLVEEDREGVSDAVFQQAREDVQEDFNSYANGHSEYMIVGVNEAEFLDWAARKWLTGECIGGAYVEEGNNGTKVARFTACEKYEPEMIDDLKKVFSDAAVYGFGMWDAPVLVTTEGENQYDTALEQCFIDGDGLRLDVVITDRLSGCGSGIGDLFCVATAGDIKGLKSGKDKYFTALKKLSRAEKDIDAMLDKLLAEKEAA